MIENSTTKCSNYWTKVLTEHYISEDQNCKLNIKLHIKISEDKSLEGTGGGLEKIA